MKHANKVVPALAVVVATFGLAACGSSSDEGKTEAVSGQFELLSGAPAADQSVSGEAALERSDGGTTVSLDVSGLDPDTEYVAHLHSEGCDQADPGGPHFKFDPSGSDEPPNEIHLEFSSGADGAGKAKASSKGEVPVGEAGSVVLHEAEAGQMTSASPGEAETVFVHDGHHHEEEGAPVAIACADLEGGASEAEPGDNPESASMGGKVPTIVIRNGEPVGGIKELEYDAGDEIRFEVSSDVADEVHVHGYDLMQDVPAGGTVSFDFPAEIEGIFEAELEGRKEQIAEIRVNP
jgi:Cu-Zn family superoxide dismutase